MRLLRKINLWLKTSLVDLLLKIYGVKIVEAKTEEQKKAVYRLRYQIYKEYGYIDPADFPNGEMRDEFDKKGINFLAFLRNQPVGVIRIIKGNRKDDFSPFQVWKVNFQKFSYPFSKIAEISKLGILKHTKNKHLIWWGLMKRVYMWSKRDGIDRWIFVTHSKLVSKIKEVFNTPVYEIPLKEKNINIEKVKKMGLQKYLEIYHPRPFYIKFEDIGKK